MSSANEAQPATMDSAQIYREETFTDRKVGTIRRLTPVAADGSPDLNLLFKAAGRYRPQVDQLDVDVWRFQQALAEAARSTDSTDTRKALETATSLYRADPLDGNDQLWIEPLREELHRRALDAHLRLAEIQFQAGEPERALEILERAIIIDPLAEEGYRRILAIQAALSRIDACRRTWKLLRQRLADLELDPEEQTVALYRTVLSAEASRTVRVGVPLNLHDLSAS